MIGRGRSLLDKVLAVLAPQADRRSSMTFPWRSAAACNSFGPRFGKVRITGEGGDTRFLARTLVRAYAHRCIEPFGPTTWEAKRPFGPTCVRRTQTVRSDAIQQGCVLPLTPRLSEARLGASGELRLLRGMRPTFDNSKDANDGRQEQDRGSM